MRGIRIDIHDPKNVVIVKKWNKKNIPVVNNVFLKQKTKRRKSDVNINNNSWIIVCQVWFSCKCKPIGMISDTH